MKVLPMAIAPEISAPITAVIEGASMNDNLYHRDPNYNAFLPNTRLEAGPLSVNPKYLTPGGDGGIMPTSSVKKQEIENLIKIANTIKTSWSLTDIGNKIKNFIQPNIPSAGANVVPSPGGNIKLNPQQISEESIIQAGQKLHLTPEQIIGGLAVAKNESGYNPYATGDNGTSFGLFQLHENGALPSSWTPQKAYNPNENAYYSLQQAFKGAPENMTAAEAQDWMTTHFERPANVLGDENPANLAAANQIYHQYSGKPELTAAQIGSLGPIPTDIASNSPTVISDASGAVAPQTSIPSLNDILPLLQQTQQRPTVVRPSQQQYQQQAEDTNSLALIDPTLQTDTGSTPQGVGDISTTSKVSKKIIENMIEANYSDEDIAKIIKQASQDKVAISFGGIINGIKNMINSNPLHPAKQMATNAAMSVIGSPASKADQQQNAAVEDALSQVGVPYQWGGTTPGKGLDCSGLAQYAWGKAGVNIPRTTYQQLADPNLQAIPTNPSAWHPGDLIYLDNGDHVGMYIGDGKVVQAPHEGTNVQVSSLDQGWNKPFAVRRPDVSGTLTSNAEANAVAVGAGGGPSNGGGGVSSAPSDATSATPVLPTMPTSLSLNQLPVLPQNAAAQATPIVPIQTTNSPAQSNSDTSSGDNNAWIPGQGLVSTSKTESNYEDIAEKEFDNEIEEFTDSLPEEPKKYNEIDESGRPGTNRKASIHEELMKQANGELAEGFNKGKENTLGVLKPVLNTFHNVVNMGVDPLAIPDLTKIPGLNQRYRINPQKFNVENSDQLSKLVRQYGPESPQVETHLEKMGIPRIASKSIHEELTKDDNIRKEKKLNHNPFEYLDSLRAKKRQFNKKDYEWTKKNSNLVTPEQHDESCVKEFENLMSEGEYDEAFMVLDELLDNDFRSFILDAYQERVS